MSAMKRFLRLAVYFLMLTLASNAVGWTFNKEAVSDVWFDEQRSSAVDDENLSTDHEASKAVSPEKPCDHWCHAIGHFMGFPSQSAFEISDCIDEHATQLTATFQPSSPDDLFRPPRTTLA